jgi:hypothetical protein
MSHGIAKLQFGVKPGTILRQYDLKLRPDIVPEWCIFAAL